MRKILILSDTHSFLDHRILFYAKKADEVWHAGDIGSLQVSRELAKYSKLRAVYGNIDNAEIRKEFPLNNIFTCMGLKVVITHIAGYPKKYNQRAKELIVENKPDVFICGHSHILKVMQDKENQLLHMNPGACGNHGFHKVRTMLRFTINNSKISELEAIELGKRFAKI